MVFDNILQAIGNTPVVKFNRVTKQLVCRLYGKCEFLNPGGSIKDRIAYQMVTQAEREGHIHPGGTLIEATSGNTGIAIALVGAVKGYKVIIAMPENMSLEKQRLLQALGAQVYLTPVGEPSDSAKSHISVARELARKLPNSYVLNQYENSTNPETHYSCTAQEIIDDMGNGLAMIVMGMGTGGTITGVARRMKEFNPDIQIVGVDPDGSILGGGDEVSPYLVEGIGSDFIPSVMDKSLVDQYIKVSDEHAFMMAKRLIKEEGLLVGGSSGAAVFAALKAARNLKPDQKCLVILPDSSRNYLSKFLNDEWIQQHNLAAGECE